jgi:hypothetical protein
MTTYDRDRKVWTFKYYIGLPVNVEVEGGLEYNDAQQAAEKAIKANYPDKVHGMDLSGADWPINPTVTLRDPDDIEELELL